MLKDVHRLVNICRETVASPDPVEGRGIKQEHKILCHLGYHCHLETDCNNTYFFLNLNVSQYLLPRKARDLVTEVELLWHGIIMMSRSDFWDFSHALGGPKWKFPALRCHLLEVLSSVTSQPGWFAGGTCFHCHRAGWHCWCQAVGIVWTGSEILPTDPLQGEKDLLKPGIILPCSWRPLEAIESTRLGGVYLWATPMIGL